MNTCDPKDNPFLEGTSRVVWSYNYHDPVNDSLILQHDQRGEAEIRFTVPNVTATPPPPTYFDVKVENDQIKFDVLGNQTQYWCTAHKITVPAGSHIVRMEPLLDPRNIKVLHHIMLFLCNVSFDPSDYDYHGGCYTPGIPTKLYNCNSWNPILYGWAVGGTALQYPDGIGYPVGPDLYVLMETHYNNIQELPIVDSSGLRLYYNQDPVEYESGVFWGGQSTNYAFTIPPQQERYEWSTWIPSECTQRIIPPTGINMIWGSLHAHTAAVAMSVKIIRNGTALPTLFDEPYYDFAFQDVMPLPQEFTLLPGDAINLICTYDTIGRNGSTYFGPTTWNEMCYFYITYYPRLPLDATYAFALNWSTVAGSNDTPGVWCSTEWISYNYSHPLAYIPYTPVCNMSTPPLNLSTPHTMTDPLNVSLYDRFAYLDDEQQYKLYWTYDKENEVIHGAVEVETDGWVGFGLGDSGMTGADVFIAWLDEYGEAHFKDRFATMEALPPADASQDYFNILVGQFQDPEPQPEKTATAKLSTRDKILIGVLGGGGALLILILIVVACCRKQKGVTPMPLKAEDFIVAKLEEQPDEQEQEHTALHQQRTTQERRETREKEKRDRE